MSRHANLGKLLRKHGVDFIVEVFRRLEGRPAGVVRDLNAFRVNVVEAAWQAAPLQIRLSTQQALAWEDFVMGLREMAFEIRDNVVVLRPGFEKELRDIVDRTPGSSRPRSAGESAHGEATGSTSSAADSRPPGDSHARPDSSGAAEDQASRPAGGPDPTPAARNGLETAGLPPTQHELVAGIDLGTTYSVAAFVDAEGRPQSVVNAEGQMLTPSVVLFDEGIVAVGQTAVEAAPLAPHNVVECVKREMGSKRFPREIDGEFLPPEVISSFILRSLKTDMERQLGPISKAVITVPAYFDESRRRATVDAGRIAGWDVIDLLNEPTAAAIAYGYRQGYLNRDVELTRDKPLQVMVYDLGGGTFDVSIVQIDHASFRTLVTDGDVRLGGKDWDEKLVEFVAEKFREITGEDPHDSPQSLERLWQAVERGKRVLSEQTKAQIEVVHRGHKRPIEVTRWQFENLTAPLLERTLTTAEIVLMQSGLSWQDLDGILLVGGSSRMPMVRRGLKDLTGLALDDTVSADEAVAHGAAIFAQVALHRLRQASSSKPEAEPIAVTDVNSHTMGVLAVDPLTGRKTNVAVIPKNTALPTTAKRRFRTAQPNQPNIQVRVLEGESDDPAACTDVGICAIHNLPAHLPAGSPVEIKFTYRSNGRLTVSANLIDHAVGVRVDFARVNSLDDADMVMWAECVQAQKGAAAVFRDVPPQAKG